MHRINSKVNFAMRQAGIEGALESTHKKEEQNWWILKCINLQDNAKRKHLQYMYSNGPTRQEYKEEWLSYQAKYDFCRQSLKDRFGTVYKPKELFNENKSY